MSAYYNEIDPACCAWLEELMSDGLIPAGHVDNRSIEDVQPTDLVGYRSCHFFAGIGIWAFALRLAGVRDDADIWTFSCPCPPFSAAGKKKACPECGGVKPYPCPRRTAYFVCAGCGHSWRADARHLYPEVWRLARERRPGLLLGEQVASEDGRTWLDIVRATLEVLGYAVGGVDTCAAGFGAFHIRQRLYFAAERVADPGRERVRAAGFAEVPGATGRVQSEDGQRERLRSDLGPERAAQSSGLAVSGGAQRRTSAEGRGDECDGADAGREEAAGRRELGGATGGLDDSTGARHVGQVGGAEGDPRHDARLGLSGEAGGPSRLALPANVGHERIGGARGGGLGPSDDGGTVGVADADGGVAGNRGLQLCGQHGLQPKGDRALPHGPARTFDLGRGPVDWLLCRDERWRPVESGTFPLADAGSLRSKVARRARQVGLKGAGNALDYAQAAEFVRAYLEVELGGEG